MFPGRPGWGCGASTLVKHSTYSDTLKINVFEEGKVPLSSKSLEHEYLFNLTFTIHVHVIKLGGNPFALMPIRIG